MFQHTVNGATANNWSMVVLVLIIRRLLALGKRRRKREGRVPEPQSRTYR